MIGERVGSGDSFLLRDVLPEKFLTEEFFKEILSEVSWREQVNRGGKVPRLLCYQGVLGEDGSCPVYRVPSDEQFSTSPLTPLVNEIRQHVERAVGQSFNHCLIQMYRTGLDYISEHSDKTLDISRGTSIANLSLGAERVMRLCSKADTPGNRETISVALPHNSLFVLGWNTNRSHMHGIRPDKRQTFQKRPEETKFGGQRISFTFRSIATFVRVDGHVYGQGALYKSEDELERALATGEYDVSRSVTVQSDEILNAFSKENHFSNFDWEAQYGRGFDILRISLNE